MALPPLHPRLHPSLRTALLACAAGLALLLLPACASTTPAPDDSALWSPGPETPAPAGAALTARQTHIEVSPSATFVSTMPGVNRVGINRTLLISIEPSSADGPSAGPFIIARVQAAADASGQGSAAGDPIENTRATLAAHLGPAGDLLVGRSTENTDAVFTIFEPDLIAMPATLVAGEPHRQEFTMVVHPIAQPSRVKARGTATQTSTYEADQSVRTPAGTFACRRVLTVFEASLGAAKVHVETRSWYAPGIGLIAEESHEQVSTLGVPFRDKRQGWVLRQAAPAAAAPAPAPRARTPG